ncbi:MAG: histidine phosphatase family protein [Deltaproteobacteria bacterium]|nr:histidine phosphatase family protein [Deltaproteobacteria bacterium]
MKKEFNFFSNEFLKLHLKKNSAIQAGMLEILFIRHGETDWNKNRRIMGHRPVPLNREGIRQVEETANSLDSIDIKAVYTSPLKRTVQTSRILARGRSVRLVEAPELTEIDYGDWVGKTFDEVGRYPAFRLYHTDPAKAQAPSGEKMKDVYRRGISWVEKIRKEHKKGRIIAVSHADVIKAILCHYLDLDLNNMLKIRIDNGSVSILWINEKGSGVFGINCHTSLEKVFSRSDQPSSALNPNSRK